MNAHNRASVEETLTQICRGIILEDCHRTTALRLVHKLGPARCRQSFIAPVRVWRAFYRRHPERMSKGCFAIQRFVKQFKAEDASAAAAHAIDTMMASHGIATTNPK